jgi:hypothetical protein
MDRLDKLLAGLAGPARGGWDERFFRLARELELVSADEKQREWIRLRRLMAEPELARLQARVARFDAGARPRLQDRKDLVLLLLYVKGRFGRLAEGICGTTRILKLLFLASKELNVDALVRNPYSFQPYRYGPFTAALYNDLDMLIEAGLVRREHLDEDGVPVIQRGEEIDEGFGFNGLTTLYRLSRKGRRVAAALLELAAKKQHNIEPGLVVVKARFGSLPLLELMRYIYSRYPEYTAESEILEKVLGARGRGGEADTGQ